MATTTNGKRASTRTPTQAELRRRVLFYLHALDKSYEEWAENRRALAATVAELHEEYGITYRELGALLGTSHVAALKLARQA